MSALNANQERNARALEVAGRMVGELIGDIRVGMFNQDVDSNQRAQIRTRMAKDFGDLTKKIAQEIVSFI